MQTLCSPTGSTTAFTRKLPLTSKICDIYSNRKISCTFVRLIFYFSNCTDFYCFFNLIFEVSYISILFINRNKFLLILLCVSIYLWFIKVYNMTFKKIIGLTVTSRCFHHRNKKSAKAIEKPVRI